MQSRPQTPRAIVVTTPDSILALDVGGKRVGVAMASLIARLPRRLTTLENNETLIPALQEIIEGENVGAIVVGLPRNLQGEHTAQTEQIEQFVAELKRELSLPIRFQDEALTSKKAEAELDAQGRNYQRGDIDSLAATYILEDFLSEQRNLVELEL